VWTDCGSAAQIVEEVGLYVDISSAYLTVISLIYCAAAAAALCDIIMMLDATTESKPVDGHLSFLSRGVCARGCLFRILVRNFRVLCLLHCVATMKWESHSLIASQKSPTDRREWRDLQECFVRPSVCPSVVSNPFNINCPSCTANNTAPRTAPLTALPLPSNVPSLHSTACTLPFLICSIAIQA